MKSFKFNMVLLTTSFFIISCGSGGPEEEKIKREFLERRPKASIVSISKEKCDTEKCVWISVKFNIPQEKTIFEDKIQYFLLDNICKDCWHSPIMDLDKRLP